MDILICLDMVLEITSQNNPKDKRYTSSLLSSQVLAEQTGLAKVFTLTDPNCIVFLTNCIIPLF